MYLNNFHYLFYINLLFAGLHRCAMPKHSVLGIAHLIISPYLCGVIRNHTARTGFASAKSKL